MSQSNQSLSERLLRYTAVAGLVTSSGVLMAPTPAHAGIIDVNCTIATAGEFCLIDFDDGGATPEFVVGFTQWSSALVLNRLTSYGGTGRSFASSPGATLWASAVAVAPLPFGATISTGAVNWNTNSFGILYTSSGGGLWNAPIGTNDSNRAYVGVAFDLSGVGPYFGWIELTIPTNGNVTVTRIGYNTTAGGAIPAAVQLSETNASNGLRGVIAVALAGLSGALLWLRKISTRAQV